MRISIRKALFTAGLLVGLLLSGCRGMVRASCEAAYPVRSGAGGTYQRQSEPGRFTYSVTRDMATTRLHLIFEQTEGKISWEFTDPTGDVRWEGEHIDAGKFDETRDFEPIEGEWNLTVDYSGGSGSYDHCWMADS